MSGRLRALVVGGGRNCEHDVSIASAASVAAGLDPSRYDVLRLTIGRDGQWWEGTTGRQRALGEVLGLLGDADIVLPIVHGPHGEDGELAALCEIVGVPYVGCPPSAGAVAIDKAMTKAVAADAGLLTIPGRLLHRHDVGTAAHTWSGPAVVKPVRAGSSHGVSLVTDSSGWPTALSAAFAIDDRVLAEEVVVGREVDLGIIDLPDGSRLVAPALEIVSEGIFDLDEKYDGSADFRVPADLTRGEAASLSAAALTAYDALGCFGLARVDFFLTAAGPVLLEVNTMPGLGPASQLPRMMAAAGLPYGKLLDTLVTTALARRPR